MINSEDDAPLEVLQDDTEPSAIADASNTDENTAETVPIDEKQQYEGRAVDVGVDEKQQHEDEVAQLKQQHEDEVAQLKQQHEDEVAQLKQEIEQLKNPPLSPKLQSLIAKACSQDTEERQKDEQELQQYWRQIEQLSEQGKRLKQGIETVIEQFTTQFLPQCQETKNQLLESVQEKLQERQNGIEIIGRMIERLPENIPKIDKINSCPGTLASLEEQELVRLSTQADLPKEINKKLKELGNQRYQQVFEMRNLAEERRKQLLNFVKQKLLPILDGLIEGQKYAEILLQELVRDYPEQESTLGQWFDFYKNLKAQIEEVLTQIGVKAINVQRGEPADYIRHSPLVAEPDAELDNEQVKEVTQKGYEYSFEENTPLQVLRPAQVIMVRNN